MFYFMSIKKLNENWRKCGNRMWKIKPQGILYNTSRACLIPYVRYMNAITHECGHDRCVSKSTKNGVTETKYDSSYQSVNHLEDNGNEL